MEYFYKKRITFEQFFNGTSTAQKGDTKRDRANAHNYL